MHEGQSASQYLEHYGMPRRSGRYPYGSGKDPYQAKERLKSALAKRKTSKEQKIIEKKKKEIAAKRKSSLEKARAEKKAKKEYEDAKEKTLKTGNASEILKYKGDLTNEQMQQAINRITLEQRLNDLEPITVKEGNDYLRKFGDEILLPAVKNVSKQLATSGMTYLANEVLLPKTKMKSSEYKVYTNNKKKG